MLVRCRITFTEKFLEGTCVWISDPNMEAVRARLEKVKEPQQRALIEQELKTLEIHLKETLDTEIQRLARAELAVFVSSFIPLPQMDVALRRSIFPGRFDEVSEAIISFLGDGSADPPIEASTIAGQLRSPLICVSEHSHRLSFKSTFAAARLPGLLFEELRTTFNSRNSSSRDLAKRSGDFSYLLYASAGLARIPGELNDAFKGRIFQAAQPLSAVMKLVDRLRRSQEDLEFRLAQAETIRLSGMLEPVNGLEVAHRSIPRRRLSGDCSRIKTLDSGSTAILVADVRGKGLSAAVNAPVLIGCFDNQLRANAEPVEMLRAFESILTIENYAPLFYGVFDPTSRTLRYVNAGQGAIHIARHRGALNRLPPTSVAPGLASNLVKTPIEAKTIELAIGDYLVIYTDGLADAGYETNEQSFEESGGLTAALNRCLHLDPHALATQIIADALRHADGAFGDDTTLIVIHSR